MAGYSSTPLVRKIGIKPGHHIARWAERLTFVRRLKDR